MKEVYGVAKDNKDDKFNSVFFSDNFMVRENELHQLERDLLLIVGGADDIFPLSSIQNIFPDDGLATIHIPGLSHFIKHPKKISSWDYWKNFMMDSIISFTKN